MIVKFFSTVDVTDVALVWGADSVIIAPVGDESNAFCSRLWIL